MCVKRRRSSKRALSEQLKDLQMKIGLLEKVIATGGPKRRATRTRADQASVRITKKELPGR
jgi:hypothetical protein